MSILKDILHNEVYPAIGCTEPAACAYAAAVAAERLGAPTEQFDLKVDVGTYKNTAAVKVPGSDGAKPGCTMKTVTGADAAMRAAFMVIEGFGLSDDDGVLGTTATESIRNLGRVSIEGMLNVDPTVVDILSRKTADRA